MRLRAFAALAFVTAALATTGLAHSYPACDGPNGRAVPCHAPVAEPTPPPPPPAPPPPPPPKLAPPPWSGPGLHVAWGFYTGQFTPEQLAAKMAATGFRWACLEGNPAPQNYAYMDRFRDALHAYGLKFCIWERDDTQKEYPESRIDHIKWIVNTFHPDFYGADLETFPLDDPHLGTEVAQAFPNLPRIILAAGMADASYYADWIQGGWAVMTQAYSGPLGQPPCPGITGSMDRDAYWRGFPANWLGLYSVPIIEIHSEHSTDLAGQFCAVQQWGDNYSIWNAEAMTDADWEAAAQYAALHH